MYKITFITPGLPYISKKHLESPNTPAGCDACIRRCQNGGQEKDNWCLANCCWACVPGRGGNCHCY